MTDTPVSWETLHLRHAMPSSVCPLCNPPGWTLPVPFVVAAWPDDRRDGSVAVTELDGDAYALGALSDALSLAAEAEGTPTWGFTLTRDEHGFWKALDSAENYWGASRDPEIALRWLLGAVLDPREES